MIAIDTSSLVAFFSGESGDDVEIIDRALSEKQVLLPPVVLTELLSDPNLPRPLTRSLLQIPIADLRPGFWERAGKTCARVLAKGFKAKIADALIAQTCIDEKVALLTRDSDFRHYVDHAGLRLF